MEYPLVYIKWVDICDNTVGWTPLVKMSEWIQPDWTVEQIGWLYEETDDYLVLINMVSESMGSVSHMTKIPKTAVIYREGVYTKLYKRQKNYP